MALASGFLLAAASGASAWGSHLTVRSAADIANIWGRGGAELTGFSTLPNVSPERQREVSLRILYAAALALLLVLIPIVTFLLVATPAGAHPWHLVLTLAASPFILIVSIVPTLLTSAGRKRSPYAEQLWMPLIRLCLFALLVLVGTPLLIALSASLLLASALVVANSFRQLYELPHQTRPQPKPPSSPTEQKLIQRVLSLGSNSMLAGVASRIDTVLVASSLGPERAGTYALIVAAASLVNLVAAINSRFFAPKLSTLLELGNTRVAVKELHRIKRWSMLASVVLSIACQIALAVLLPAINFRYGNEEAITAAICTITYSVAAAYGPSGYFLSTRGLASAERKILIPYALVFVVGASIGTQFGLPYVAASGFAATAIMMLLRDMRVSKLLSTEISVTGSIPAERVVLSFLMLIATALITLRALESLSAFAFAAAFITASLPIHFILLTTPPERRMAVTLISKLYLNRLRAQ